MQIRKIIINSNNCLNNTSFSSMVVKKIIIKVPMEESVSQVKNIQQTYSNPISIGLFINNNPYLIRPIFNGFGEWELDTHNQMLISSIKFDHNTKEKLINLEEQRNPSHPNPYIQILVFDENV